MSADCTKRAVVRVAFARMWQGFDPLDFFKSFLKGVLDEFDFQLAEHPDFLIYGPYGGSLPASGNAVRIYFGCENVRPDMRECDWAFSYDYDEVVRHPRHLRAVFHSDERFIKPALDPAVGRAGKRKFCNFIYGNRVPFREEFCRRLSAYKPVDCPGKALNNMPSFDQPGGKPWWESKLDFIAEYKFTIAFENSSHPGYNTEKIFQPMFVNSVPIYWGDPLIHRDYNPRSFVNYYDVQDRNRFRLPALPLCWNNSLKPDQKWTLGNRLANRVNRWMEQLNQAVWLRSGFDRLIQRIVELDQNDALYEQMLAEPWCYGNRPPDQTAYWTRWREIFRSRPAGQPGTAEML